MRHSIQNLRRTQQSGELALRGAIRRMLISGSEGALSTVVGGEDSAGNVETDSLETFGVAGITSRPAVRPEAIVVSIGGRGHTVIVATRDRGMSAATATEDDEIAISTSKVFVKITAAGEVLIGRPDGAFERVVTESHVHGPGVLTNGGGPVTGITGKALVNPGTTPGETALVGRGMAAVAKAETTVGL